MIVVPQSFRTMPRWWSDVRGRAWLEHLPTLVAESCEQWGLTVDGPVLHGSNALIVPVRGGGQRAVLRLVSPSDDLAVEVAALTHWSGNPVVRLLDADLSTGACLLERLDYTASLLHEPVLEAIAVLGSLARTLAIEAPSAVRSTHEIAEEAAADFERQWQDLGRPGPRRVLDAAMAEARDLARQDDDSRSVDGDLHFEQVLRGERFPWIVVDPVLLRGDREYDIGRVLWSRLDELSDASAVRAAFHTFVESAAVPTERARAWLVVRSMSYLLWGLRNGLTRDPPKCRRLLELFT